MITYDDVTRNSSNWIRILLGKGSKLAACHGLFPTGSGQMRSPSVKLMRIATQNPFNSTQNKGLKQLFILCSLLFHIPIRFFYVKFARDFRNAYSILEVYLLCIYSSDMEFLIKAFIDGKINFNEPFY